MTSFEILVLLLSLIAAWTHGWRFGTNRERATWVACGRGEGRMIWADGQFWAVTDYAEYNRIRMRAHLSPSSGRPTRAVNLDRAEEGLDHWPVVRDRRDIEPYEWTPGERGEA